MTENISTVPVIATDLRVGDVFKGSDGRYYTVDTPPEPIRLQEYSAANIAFRVTEMNEDMTPVANSTRVIHEEDAELEVLTPRPEE